MAVTKRELNVISHSFEWEGQTISFETGKLAPHADGAVKIQMGENILLVTAVINKKPDLSKDFLPLMIDWREMYSAAGRIAGAAYRRREGRPSDNAILYARLTDRTIRPLFPKGMINDMVLSITPLAIDGTEDLGVMSIIGASVAMMAAGIPMSSVAGAARIGRVDGQFIINPTKEQIEKGDCNLLVAWPKGVMNMIECDATEIEEADIKKAFELGQKHIDLMCDVQEEFLKKLTITSKQPMFNNPSEMLMSYVHGLLTQDWKEKFFGPEANFNDAFYAFQDEVFALAKDKIDDNDNEDFTPVKIKIAVFRTLKHEIRHKTIHEWVRLDGRAMDQIRPLYCEVDAVPRVHGSGLFWRGGTQVHTTLTLGAPSDYLILDNMEDDQVHQKYFHHYNFPPFSTNEARGTRGAGRREIGHGKLAEKALEIMMPDKVDFPYTIRVVSECLWSWGSTSMGSVCGSTLALMAWWVPIKSPVSGIAMGMMSEKDDNGNITKYQILTDLKGTEDFTWDMDFKVAGTKKGVTAIQLDTKVKGLTLPMVFETIEKANIGRNEILDFMLQTIAEPRKETSPYAPKIVSFVIPEDRIRKVIGKGGETIDKIIEAAGGVKIDFEDDGTVFIADTDMAKIQKARELIEDIALDLPLNQEIEWKVARVEAYGVFVELPRNKSGLCHIKALGLKWGTVEAAFKVGDPIKVLITEIDQKGRYNLKRVL